MARKLRFEYAGACYHVINRGNYRRDLFVPEGAAEAFTRCLFEASGKFAWRLHAYVIMRNHFHLAVETPEPNLSEGMKWLQGTWAARFNRFHGEAGRPFQGRYKALHVEPGHALAQVAHYIHLNPVRAGVVPAERLLEYRWSSLPRFAGKRRPDCLEARIVLAESGALADDVAGWRRYLAYLEVVAEEESSRRDEKFGRLSKGWFIGSSDFGKILQQEMVRTTSASERFVLLGADRDAVAEARAMLWEERLRWAAGAFGIALDRLPPQKSALEKVRLAAFMKMTTSVSNGWLATRLDMGTPGSITQFVRRFHLAGHTRHAVFSEALSIVRT